MFSLLCLLFDGLYHVLFVERTDWPSPPFLRHTVSGCSADNPQ